MKGSQQCRDSIVVETESRVNSPSRFLRKADMLQICQFQVREQL